MQVLGSKDLLCGESAALLQRCQGFGRDAQEEIDAGSGVLEVVAGIVVLVRTLLRAISRQRDLQKPAGVSWASSDGGQS